MVKLSDIKAELELINSTDIYAEDGLCKVIEAYTAFADKYMDDERAGTVKLVERALKLRDKADAELDRLSKMLEFEKQFYDAEFIAGVDEVGRGPLAGPIVTAAVILPKNLVIPYLNDSKQLSEEKREELYNVIMDKAVAVACGLNSEKVIDDIGIAPADSDAMKQAVLRLSTRPDFILVDAFPIKELDIKQYPIIKGDAKSLSIAAASIIAKVTRDRMMVKLDEKYPGYGFAKNKGYGSADHIKAIKEIGPCPAHRRSFIKNFM